MTANPYIDKFGRHVGYCNACGEEAELDQSCDDSECSGGEVVPYDDDPEPDA